MNSLFVLIPLSLLFAAGAVWAFFWAAESGQFDDLQSAGWDVLLDDDDPRSNPSTDSGQSLSGQSPREPTND